MICPAGFRKRYQEVRFLKFLSIFILLMMSFILQTLHQLEFVNLNEIFTEYMNYVLKLEYYKHKFINIKVI